MWECWLENETTLKEGKYDDLKPGKQSGHRVRQSEPRKAHQRHEYQRRRAIQLRAESGNAIFDYCAVHSPFWVCFASDGVIDGEHAAVLEHDAARVSGVH